MAKMPKLKQLHQKYSKSLQIVGINFDEKLSKYEAGVKTIDVPWQQIHAATSSRPHDDAWQAIASITRLPRIFLVDPNGVLVKEIGASELETVLHQTLSK